MTERRTLRLRCRYRTRRAVSSLCTARHNARLVGSVTKLTSSCRGELLPASAAQASKLAMPSASMRRPAQQSLMRRMHRKCAMCPFVTASSNFWLEGVARVCAGVQSSCPVCIRSHPAQPSRRAPRESTAASPDSLRPAQRIVDQSGARRIFFFACSFTSPSVHFPHDPRHGRRHAVCGCVRRKARASASTFGGWPGGEREG